MGNGICASLKPNSLMPAMRQQLFLCRKWRGKINRFGFKLAHIPLPALQENYIIFFYDNIDLFEQSIKVNLGAVRLSI